MPEIADVKMAVLKCAMGIQALEERELYEHLERFWAEAFKLGCEASKSPRAPIVTNLPRGFQALISCAGCGVQDRPGARHWSKCPIAAGELVRPEKANGDPV